MRIVSSVLIAISICLSLISCQKEQDFQEIETASINTEKIETFEIITDKFDHPYPIATPDVEKLIMNTFEIEQKSFEDDILFNITPENFKNNYGFELYKSEKNFETYLIYKNYPYRIGTGFGGFGAISFAACDLNCDGNSELYYTFSFGSGIHRSHIGYFDTADNLTHVFDKGYFGYDMSIKDDGDRLTLHHVGFEPENSENDITDDKQIGEVFLDNGEITLELNGEIIKLDNNASLF